MQCKGAKSFADDLVTGQGVVLSRAASTLRSVETQPSVGRFVFHSATMSHRSVGDHSGLGDYSPESLTLATVRSLG